MLGGAEACSGLFDGLVGGGVGADAAGHGEAVAHGGVSSGRPRVSWAWAMR